MVLDFYQKRDKQNESNYSSDLRPHSPRALRANLAPIGPYSTPTNQTDPMSSKTRSPDSSDAPPSYTTSKFASAFTQVAVEAESPLPEDPS